MLAAGLASFSLLYATQALLPSIGRAFDVGPAVSSLTVSGATGALAVTLLPLSSLAETYGRPRVMRIGLTSACLLTALSALAPTMWLLVAARVLVGVALAGVVAVALGHLGAEVPAHRVGSAIGLYVAGTSLGGVLGRLIPGLVQDVGSWRVAILVLAGCSSVLTAAFGLLLPAARQVKTQPTRLASHIAAVSDLWKDRGIRRLCATAFLLMGGFVGCYNFLTFRLIAAPLLVSSGIASLLFLAYLAGTVSAAVVGRFADRYGRRFLITAAILAALSGLALTLPDQLGLIAVGLVIFTAGFFAAHALASAWIIARAKEHGAQGSAMYLMAYYLGSSALGAGLGLVFHEGGWSATVVAIGGCFLAALWLVSGLDSAV